MSKENFQKALEFLFPAEGGYVNHKNDYGGSTNMGVTQRTYNAYRTKKNLPYKSNVIFKFNHNVILSQ